MWKMHPLGAGAEAISRAKKLKNLGHKHALEVLVDSYPHYLTFHQLAEEMQCAPSRARRYVRHLTRIGLAEYSTLFRESDMMLAGSGHAATTLGKAVHSLIEKNGLTEGPKQG